MATSDYPGHPTVNLKKQTHPRVEAASLKSYGFCTGPQVSLSIPDSWYYPEEN